MGYLAAYLCGFTVAAAFGVMHHIALTGVLRIAPHDGPYPALAVFVTFSSLLALHTAEFTALGGLNYWLFGSLFPDAFDGPPPGFVDILHLTGISFTTVGYASLEAKGPFRILLMFQSLLGFMLLTWSATFLFAACQQSWRGKGRSDDRSR